MFLEKSTQILVTTRAGQQLALDRPVIADQFIAGRQGAKFVIFPRDHVASLQVSKTEAAKPRAITCELSLLEQLQLLSGYKLVVEEADSVQVPGVLEQVELGYLRIQTTQNKLLWVEPHNLNSISLWKTQPTQGASVSTFTG